MRFSGVLRLRAAMAVGAVSLAVVLVSGSVPAASARHGRRPHRVADQVFAAGRPGFSTSPQAFAASAVRLPHAQRTQLPARPGAEVPWLRRADSDTYLAGSGRLITKVYPRAVNYRTRSGLEPIDTRLVSSGGGWAQQANDLGVRLPQAASSPAVVKTAAGGLALAPRGVAGTGWVAGTVEKFTPQSAGAGLSYASLSDGIGWRLSAPSSRPDSGVQWVVTRVGGLTARMTRTGVGFFDRQGRLAWEFRAPVAIRPAATRPLGTRLSLRRAGDRLVISVNTMAGARRWHASTRLASGRMFAGYAVGAARTFDAALASPQPVVFSGEVVQGTQAALGEETGDCYLDSAAPDTSFCSEDTNYVGPDDHTLINFDVAGSLPAHVQVLQAFVSMTVNSETTGTAEPIGVWQAAQPWTNFATWNTYDGTDAWNTAGGDTTGAMEDVATVGASGDVGGADYWDIYASMQDWIDQKPGQVDGLLFAATDGADAPNTVGFDTETGEPNNPYLFVYYEPRMGDYPNARYDLHRLTDRSRVGVNVATGNLLLANDDVDLPGVNGLDLRVGRDYNNLSTDQDAFGVGWAMGDGADTYLTIPSDADGTVDYFDGTGNAQVFHEPSSTGGGEISPPGEDAVLAMNAPGDTWDSTSFSLLFRHTGITKTFTTSVGLNKVARLTSVTDRDGNTITYHYNANEQLDQITDTHGSALTISYSPAGYISEIADATGRTWHYTQNTLGELTGYEDPAGNTTTYTYNGAGSLTQITTPQGYITKVGYDASTGRVTQLKRYYDANTADASYKTTYQFASPTGACPSNDGWTQATVKDPNGNVTTYCTDELSRLTQRADPLGRAWKVAYSNDGYVNQTTAPSGTPTTYAHNSDDSLTGIQDGASDGATTPLTWSLDYTGSANPYAPATVTDPQGNQIQYGYDNAGDRTSATDQLPAQNEASLTYNNDGTVATATDPDGNQTTYGYTAGNLTTVTPPSGSGLNPITLSYDADSRVSEVSTVADGTGHEVDYTHDTLDRITQATYKNAAGDTVATIAYGYDNDGNRISRTDPAGTTTDNYDGLDQLTTTITPDAVTHTYTYDGAGNLATLTDSGGTVTYGYDKANELTKVTDPGALKPTATFAYDSDGNRTKTTYASGASMTATYNPLDQLTGLTDAYKTAGGQIGQLSYAYTYDGEIPATLTDQAGNVTSYAYDALNRLTEASTSASDGLADTTTTYNYDADGRLDEAATTAAPDYVYTLDGDGNITELDTANSITSYAYNSGNEICWSYDDSSANGCDSPPDGAHAYTYDTGGNQTSDGNGLTVTYNAPGQTTSITSAGTTTSYSYLGAGQNEPTTEGSTTLGNDMLGIASQTTGSGTTYYSRSPAGREIDERTSTGTYDYLYDPTGSVIGLVDSKGHLVNQYAYDPYGNQTTVASAVANPFGYHGSYRTTSGVDHTTDGYLNPAAGRYLQPLAPPAPQALQATSPYVFGSAAPTDPPGSAPPSIGPSAAGVRPSPQGAWPGAATRGADILQGCLSDVEAPAVEGAGLAGTVPGLDPTACTSTEQELS